MRPSLTLPELWGGPECTVNRVQDVYFDQLRRSGHWTRPEDLDPFAALGLKALRYPVLWELTAPRGPSTADWRWADARLPSLKELGVRPIIGLLHHGSGPRDTSLVDEALPARLADYAGALAARFPWVRDYTPVNEPLTTARFSGLYGHWYPHGQDDATFVQTLLVQTRATVEAMQAIRRIRPDARLVQTEDMGRTFAAPGLQGQADFENERRWLSFDLLCGRVDRGHPLWKLLRGWGASERALGYFLEHPTPPDVVGLNYYVTSDRFLDPRLHLYPEGSHGGNGRDAYADVEAARASPAGIWGHANVLRAAWSRYGLPVALTEVHLGAGREDQLRWLKAAWDDACQVSSEGVDVQGVTVWSLLGAFDWNSLVTVERGHYEPGAFDVRSNPPRPTALARLTADLARGSRPTHPVLAAPGWWQRDDRLFSTLRPRTSSAANDSEATKDRCRPLLITGGQGTLARAFARLCVSRGLAHHRLTRQELDIASQVSVRAAIERHQPWAIINAAGFVRVDDAESDIAGCLRENLVGPEVLSVECARAGVKLVTFSSDLVFDGAGRGPYLEDARPRPLSVYGYSKAEAEALVLRNLPEALVVRTSAFFGPWDRHNFLVAALSSLARGEVFHAADDVKVSPTYLPDLVHVTLDLLIDEERGLWHLANHGSTSWAQFAQEAASRFGLDASRIEARPHSTLGLRAQRPRQSVLASQRGGGMPSLASALDRFVRECDPGVSALWGHGFLRTPREARLHSAGG